MKLNLRRSLVQFCATLLYNANMFMPLTGKGVMLPSDSVCVPGLNCQYCRYASAGCPLGITQQALAGNITKVAWTFWGLIVLFGLLLGRMVCGWLCPAGFFQDILDKAPFPKIKKNQFTYYLSYLKYVIGIVFVVGLPLYTGYFTPRGVTAFCARICPGNLMEAVILPNLLRGDWNNLALAADNSKFIAVMLLLAAMLFIYRPFCRFICPLGAFYGFFNKFALLGMKVDGDKCINCNACIRKCRMDVKKAGDHECIGCGQCLSVCPKSAINSKNPFIK